MAESTVVRISKWQFSREELAQAVYHLFRARGYRLARGTKTDGMYAKGWGILWLIFGGWVKRYRFMIEINDCPTIRLEQYLHTKPVQGLKMSAGGYGIPGGGTVVRGAFGSVVNARSNGRVRFDKEFRDVEQLLREL